MKKCKQTKFFRDNYNFIDTATLNNETFNNYLDRLEKVALSIFEWTNLPSSMDSIFLEKCLFYDGQASLLKDEKIGFINTRCSSNGNLNIYGLPTKLNCYSYGYQSSRKLYTGLNTNLTKAQQEYMQKNECILVRNDWKRIPTCSTIGLFALRLYEAERSTDVNIKGQKYPVIILTDEKQRLTMKNLYNQYDGNAPVIFGDKNIFDENSLKAINTESPFVADKLQEYKKEIWNEVLTFLGVNNIMVDKKERLITDEANSNNELINLNLQSYYAPRKLACKQFNEKYGLTGTDKEIDVKIRSDLHNILKQEESVITKYNNESEVEENG